MHNVFQFNPVRESNVLRGNLLGELCHIFSNKVQSVVQHFNLLSGGIMSHASCHELFDVVQHVLRPEESACEPILNMDRQILNELVDVY